MLDVIQGFGIAIFAIVLGGYLFGWGFWLASKHTKATFHELKFTANLLASEEAVEEMDEMPDSGPGLPDHLKGYHQ